jgi:glucose-1-phosphate adenylyltransferase
VAHRFGIVTTDKDERIIDFVEKPESPQSNLVSMGIYVFNKRVLMERLIEDAALAYSPHDFGHAILPSIVNRDRIFAYRFDGYWRDIGNPQAYYEANMELLLPKPSFSLDGARPVLTESSHLAAPKRSQKGSIENSLVSPGCTIKGRVENSILSPGVWVGEEAVVRDSVIMKDTFIDYHSIIDQCVLDEKVNVGKYCYLGIGGTVTSGKWSITVVGEGVAVPPHTAVGRNCKILPHIGSSDFTGKVVLSNSVLSPKQAVKPLRTERKEVFANVSQGIRAP